MKHHSLLVPLFDSRARRSISSGRSLGCPSSREPAGGEPSAGGSAPRDAARTGRARWWQLGLVASFCLSMGCSDDQRLSQGRKYSLESLGRPGVVLIDDMEDGNQYIISDDGFNGLWYIYNDESSGSTQQPELGFPMTINGAAGPARPCRGFLQSTPFFASETECNYVAHTSGGGQLGWGAGIGLDLNGDGGAKNPVDASMFAGIAFFARGNTRNATLRVKIQDASSTPESAAAADARGIPRCNPPATAPCADHFGFNITNLSNEWQWYAVPWEAMETENYGFLDSSYFPVHEGGAPIGFHTEALVGIQFQVQGADPADTGMPTQPVEDFEFSIDNLGFVESFLAPTLVAESM